MSAISTAENQTIAWLFGQPVTEIPQDLFIPPDALTVVLQSFEGPLDLLLYLIRKQNIDVLDIPMLTITEQYLSYIAQMQKHELDLTAEYLLMAAVLIEIKTRLLLPSPPPAEEEEIDPRAELVRRLLAYEQMKLAAAELDALPRAGRDFGWAWLPVEIIAVTQPPQVQVADLTRAWLAILARAQHNRSHHVVKESLSVRAQMTSVLRYLHTHQQCKFTELFGRNDSLAMVVTTFIALLELAKEGLVQINQNSATAPILIQAMSQ
ncbi:segregation/condensation protein A [Snodgrassella sp. B3882]|uniref:segregation and condensation protein A n=1 Tax=Snodgrassella sp. B3882 TaxID=2818037 RepID=UPI00226A4FE7|nr:ScpA family protein [Snodgrassella sp. B3882]MCX8745063.1 segregation/condensation protein A [Snodgrassella sp. B3882]